MKANSLPPQAYTRETLLQAFDWFNKQPPATRQMAKTVDSLVSLYLTQMRREKSHFYTEREEIEEGYKKEEKQNKKEDEEREEKQEERSDFDSLSNSPSQFVSTQVVKKNITQKTTHRTEVFKKRLKTLSSSSHSNRSSSLSPSTSFSSSSSASSRLPSSLSQEREEKEERQERGGQEDYSLSKREVERGGKSSFESESFFNLLDKRSLKIIEETRVRLNLSSETEALRLLLSLGFEKVYPLLPSQCL